MSPLFQWIDIIWIPLGYCVAKREQRFWVVSTIAACMIMMRLLAELMESIGHPNGILGLVSFPVLLRGQLVYVLFFMMYLLYIQFFKTTGPILMAASVGLFFMTFFTFAAVMVL